MHIWVPSIGISGGMFYTGDRFPQWKGNLFVGGMVGQQLARLTLQASASRARKRWCRRWAASATCARAPTAISTWSPMIVTASRRRCAVRSRSSARRRGSPAAPRSRSMTVRPTAGARDSCRRDRRRGRHPRCRAQRAAGPDCAGALRAQIDRIYTQQAFAAPRFGPARWMPDGTAYAIVERACGGRGVRPLRRGDRGEQRPRRRDPRAPGREDALDIDDYARSADGKRLLIFTNTAQGLAAEYPRRLLGARRGDRAS